jgi:hypothetical protein
VRLTEDWLAKRFAANLPHMRQVAFRLLGSGAEADDAVQAAWLKLSRTDAGDIENIGGWLTTVVARVSIDMLRKRRSRREEPAIELLPLAASADPEGEAVLADSVGEALLLLLDTLTPPGAAGVRPPRDVRHAVRGARRWPAEAIWVVRREPQRRADRADYVPAGMKAGGTLGPSTIPAPAEPAPRAYPIIAAWIRGSAWSLSASRT